MTIQWNPTAKQIEGLEHAPVGYAHLKSVNYQDQWAINFQAKYTGQMQAVQIYLPASANSVVNGPSFNFRNSPVLVELHAEGDEDTGAPIHDVYVPSNLFNFTGSFTLLDYAYGTPDTTDISANDDGNGLRGFAYRAFFDTHFDTAAFPLTRRVIRYGLGHFVNLSVFDQRARPNAEWEGTLVAFAPTTHAEIGFYHGEGFVPYAGTAWEWWTPQDIRDYRSGGPGHFYRVSVEAGAGSWLLDHVRMHVISVPENRIGVGINHYVPGGSPPQGRWFEIPLLTPAGTGAPTVTNGNRYTLIVRRQGGDSLYTTSQFAESPMRYLRGSSLSSDMVIKPVLLKEPDDAHLNPQEGFWMNGTIQVLGLGEQVEGIPCVRFVSGGVVQPGSQPYEYQEAAPVFGVHDIPTSNAPSTGYICTQAIVLSGTGELYGQVIATVGIDPTRELPNSDLTWELRNNVNVVIASGASITAAEWAALPDNLPFSSVDAQGIKYKRVRALFPGAVAPSAGVYTLIAKSAACAESKRWHIGILSSITDTMALLARNQSFGGPGTGGQIEFSTGARVVPDANGAVTNTYQAYPTTEIFADAQMVLTTVPVAPTGVGAEPVLTAAHHVSLETCSNPGDPECAEETVPGVEIHWNSVASTGVTSYQIQRQDNGEALEGEEVDFNQVAWVSSSELSWTDYEAPIGNLVGYRVRAYRDSDGVPGRWSDTVYTAIPSGRVALAFTSNWATGMAVTYPEAWEGNRDVEREFQFAEYDDVERRLIYGKDGQSSFHPTERRGVVFARILLLNALVTVAEPTLDLVKPLRDISWAQLPYVCVRDGEGNRWFASLIVPSIVNRRRGERWFAEIGVTEATKIASMVDTREPQVGPP